MTNTQEIIRHSIDLDLSSYDVTPDEGAVMIHGGQAVLAFNGCAVEFDLTLYRDGGAVVAFSIEDLRKTGCGLGLNRLERAVLYVLREQGILTPALIDTYLDPETVGSGSYERLQFASGAAIFADSTDCEDGCFQLLYFAHSGDECPLVITDPIQSWLEAPAALREATDGNRIPAETLEALQRWIEGHPEITGFKADKAAA